jgi:ABC-type phosphate/phosphonate transport system substrate-binding protein
MHGKEQLMRRIAGPIILPVALFALLAAPGCHSTSERFLGLFGLQKHPLSLALVADQPTKVVVQALNPFPSYAPLQKALSEQVGRPVAVDICFPFQADSGLTSGWYDLAVVTPAQYAAMARPASVPVLAVAVDQQDRPARSALLVVAADSPLRSIPNLRGRAVAFGPPGDSRTHYAGLQLLESAGLKKSDLALELLPVPGTLKHLPDMRAVAQAVVAGGAAAGFIDEAAWEALPEHQAKEGEPARDKLRVIARTCALPDTLIVASAKLDSATADQVQSFLLTAGKKHPTVLRPLAVSGYQVPPADLLTTCRGLAAVTKGGS